jgi:hypothetical protein
MVVPSSVAAQEDVRAPNHNASSKAFAVSQPEAEQVADPAAPVSN